MNNKIDLLAKKQNMFKSDADLKMLGDELKQIARVSEKEFMFIGSRLQEFFTMTDRIAKRKWHEVYER